MRQEALVLTECGVSPEDGHVRLGFRSENGADSTLVVSLEQAGSLLMTLPRLIERALRTLYADPSLRFVFPLKDWTLETAPDERQLILNLKTPDGFAVSFTLAKDLAPHLAAALSDSTAFRPLEHYRH